VTISVCRSQRHSREQDLRRCVQAVRDLTDFRFRMRLRSSPWSGIWCRHSTESDWIRPNQTVFFRFSGPPLFCTQCSGEPRRVPVAWAATSQHRVSTRSTCSTKTVHRWRVNPKHLIGAPRQRASPISLLRLWPFGVGSRGLVFLAYPPAGSRRRRFSSWDPGHTYAVFIRTTVLATTDRRR